MRHVWHSRACVAYCKNYFHMIEVLKSSLIVIFGKWKFIFFEVLISGSKVSFLYVPQKQPLC